ncbi:MAG: hypothetical protein L3J39_13825 [Verrucomicrobiales bacterium]|nr:hypothetical protein [Verrucomicrobiales bacterium]
MALFKRFELWLLLILIGGGLYYVLQVESPKHDRGREPLSQIEDEPTTQPAAQDTPRFSLEKTTITRDGDHFIVQIDLQCQQSSGKTLRLQTPHTQLLASGARAMEVFFLPFQPQPTLAEAEGKTFTLRYWLTRDDLKSPLTLKIDNTEVPIKKSAHFDPDSLPTQQSKTFTTAEWH